MLKRLFIILLVLCAIGGAVYGGLRLTAKGEPPLDRATALFAQQNVIAAQGVVRNLVRVEPRNAEAHLLLAQTQLVLADWISVEKEAKILRALRYDRVVVNAMLARAYVMQGHYQDVLTDIPGVVGKPDEQAVNLALRSWAYLGLNDMLQAQASLDAAQRLVPTEPLVVLQAARMALARRDLVGAEAKVDDALRQRPGSILSLLFKADVLEAKGDLPGAVSVLDEAVGIAPSSPQVRLARARLLLDLRQDKRAQADVDAVLDILPHENQASFYKAWLLLRNKQYADAAMEFDKMSAVLDQFPRAYLYKAQAAVHQGNLQSALDSVERLLKLRPNDVEALHLAAALNLQTRQPLRAIALLEPVVAATPGDSQSIDLLGRAYFMLGRTDDAVARFRQASLLAPDNKDYSAHLAAAKTEFGVAPLPGEVVVLDPNP